MSAIQVSQLHPLMAEILDSHARLSTRFAAPDTVAELQSIADGMRARAAAKRAAVPVVTQTFRVAPSREALLAELAIEQQGFDAAYPWSDDHAFFCFQAQKEARIKALEVLLSGVAS